MSTTASSSGSGRRQNGVEGVHIVRSARPGKPIRWYIYAWRGGPRIRVAEQPTRPKLTPADAAAIGAAHEQENAPGDTIKGLSAEWTRSREWRALAPGTRDLWARCLVRIEQKWGEVPLRLFGDPRMTPKIVKWRDEIAVPVETENGGRTRRTGGLKAADEHVKALDQMLGWGLLRGRVLFNAAAPVPRLWLGGNREEIIWLPEDCAAFDAVEKVPPWLVDARRLAEFTGLRCADLAALRWSEISETHIARTASKKSRGKRKRVVMPIVPGLRELLEELKSRKRQPEVGTVLVGTLGRSIKARTLTAEFIKYRNLANGGEGIWHRGQFEDEPDRTKHLHDLRGTFATKLMTLPGGSLTDEQIATIMGWSKDQVATIRRRYVDEAAIVVAIGKRIAEASAVKPDVKQGPQTTRITRKNAASAPRDRTVMKLGKVPDRGYVYFLGEPGGPIKIGFSRKPEQRVSTLATSSHRPIKLLAMQEGDEDLEKHYHQQFKDYRIRGEWFNRCQELEDLIDLLSTESANKDAGIA